MIIAIDGLPAQERARSHVGSPAASVFATSTPVRCTARLTWLALERAVPLGDGEALGALALSNPVSFTGSRVAIAGEDVTEGIRAAGIDRTVSTVARHEAVRRVMRARQRELAAEGAAVVEGRDIGRVVCPDAEVKVWLEANPEERVRRRFAERPEDAADELAADLELRDERDVVQMQPAPDAERIDTTELTIEEVVTQIERLVLARSTT